MDNKKLFKFLYKDIAELEELIDEKGAEGFDELEMEFIRTRFSGAKRIIQLLSEKDENANQKAQVTEKIAVAEAVVEITTDKVVAPRAEFTTEEKESLKDLAAFEEEVKESDNNQPISNETSPNTEIHSSEQDETNEGHIEASKSDEKINEDEEDHVEVEPAAEVSTEEDTKDKINGGNENYEVEKEENDNSLTASTESNTVTNRIGDRVVKEKSVNDLLLGKDNLKLEYKISNSPVKSIQTAIGINDRYQYIRELFEGSADNFTKTVSALDKLNNINEAVSYLQENFKWKKNETSLKFVNLVKRRFPNG
ncbi:MAG TPA: hypothetical protein VEP89_11655 [Draconibacterium sp.]|nr:hypothetical protein [Draconibacterium sp.]